jgi:hypothetical protein
MGTTLPAHARQAPACGLQGLGTLQRFKQAKRAKRAKRANRVTQATRPKPATASLRSTLICRGRPKIDLQPLTPTPC